MVPFESSGYTVSFALHSNHDRIYSRFDTIHERDRHQVTVRAALRSLARLQSRGKNSHASIQQSIPLAVR